MSFSEYAAAHPIVPYVRRAAYGMRREEKHTRDRRLLDYHLIYFQKGSCMLHVEGKSYPLKQGDFALLQPGWLNSMESAGELVFPFVCMDIFYNPDRERSFVTLPGMTDLSDYAGLRQPVLNDISGVSLPVQLHPERPDHWKDTLLKLISIWSTHNALARMEANHYASELLLALFRQYLDHPGDVSAEMQSLNWIPRYLRMFYNEPITVEQLARKANLSASHFSAVFKRKFDETPHRYLLRIRLREAQRMLRSSDLTLAEIAEECGFVDMQHLLKMFKKYFGITPGAFRKSN